jgi:hypothetical protein
LKALRIQQPARYLGAGDSVLGADLRILGKVDFDTPLRVDPQQQTRDYQYPKKRIFEHLLIPPVPLPKAG